MCKSNRTREAQTNPDEVAKVDSVARLMDGEIGRKGGGAKLAGMKKVVGQEDIETLGRLPLSEHRPLAFDYVGKFGLAPFLAVVQPMRAVDAPPQADVPQCPKCASSMIKRQARTGPNTGNYFWGCSGFPECRGVIARESNG